MASRSWNRVELIGNLTKDPELRYTPQGTAVVTFSIATNRTYMSDGERKEEADFHRCVAWNKLAELCSQLLKKGNRVFVSGRLQNRSWEAQDGQTKYITEIVIEDMILLTSKSGFSQEGSDDYSQAPPRPVARPTVKEEAVPEEVLAELNETPVAEKEEASKEEKKEEATPKKAASEDPGDLDDLPF